MTRTMGGLVLLPMFLGACGEPKPIAEDANYKYYATEDEARRAGECANPYPNGEKTVLVSTLGFACEVQYRD